MAIPNGLAAHIAILNKIVIFRAERENGYCIENLSVM